VTPSAGPGALANTPAGSLVPFGPGKALYAEGHGRFLLVVLDDKEIVVERVFALVWDPRRYIGSKLKRDHGYYFEDLSDARSDTLARLQERFRKAVADDPITPDQVDQLADLARRIAGFHSVPFLLDFIKSDRFTIRKSVAVALAEQGYLVAIPELRHCLDTGDSKFRRHLADVLEELTGRRFIKHPESKAQEEAETQLVRWWREHKPKSRYALGRSLIVAQEKRLGER